MKRLCMVSLFVVLGSSAIAQQWCAPGACWTYHTYLGSESYKLHHYQNVGDSVVNGILHQRIDVHSRVYSPTGVIDQPDFTELIRMEGAAVISDHSNMTWNSNGVWDTIQYFGNIGDRWWPPNAEENCPPQGMLQIMDTGHVVIDEVSLGTWHMAYLDINGIPMMTAGWPLAPFTVTERIGIAPRMPNVYMCQITEADDVQLLSYTDADISFPQGASCDLPMADPANSDPTLITLLPNPGSDQLTITGLSPGAKPIEVHDPLGCLVFAQSMVGTNAAILTSSWASGIYFVRVIGSVGNQQLLRWVKQ